MSNFSNGLLGKHIRTVCLAAGLVILVLVSPVLAQVAKTADPNKCYYLRNGDVVMFLGDSITADSINAYYGYVFFNDLNTKYPLLVQKNGVAAKDFDGPGVKFVNAGLKGDTAAGGLARIDDLLTKNKPTIAVICYGMQDRITDRAAYQDNLRKLVKKLKDAKVDVTIMTAPSICTKKHPEYAKYVSVMGELAAEARKVAQDEGVGFADCFTPMLALEDKHEVDFTIDGRIPNRAVGARMMADALQDSWGFGLPLVAEGSPRRKAWPSGKAAEATTTSAPAANLATPAENEARRAVWENITGNVGGDKWGIGGVTLVAPVPGSRQMIAGVADAGLWSSERGSGKWTKLAGSKAFEKGKPSQIVFDPKNPKVFFVAMVGGPGLFKTADGGETFEQLGKFESVAGISVSFDENGATTILAGISDKARSLYCSTDGGKTWENIGKSLPEKANFSTDPIIVDDRTFLANAAGSNVELAFGIYRTEDSGATWRRTSEFGPTGRPLLMPDGVIYWSRIWSEGLIKSTDGGKTWAALEGVIKKTPISLPGGRFVGANGRQLCMSIDECKTWKPVGEPLAITPIGIVYSEARNAVYVWWSSGDQKVDNAIWRVDLPK